MRQKAKLLRRNAYGLDESAGADTAVEGLNIEDTATPMNQHKTTVNPGNLLRDVEAETDFKGLGKHMQRFPSRGKG